MAPNAQYEGADFDPNFSIPFDKVIGASPIPQKNLNGININKYTPPNGLFGPRTSGKFHEGLDLTPQGVARDQMLQAGSEGVGWVANGVKIGIWAPASGKVTYVDRTGVTASGFYVKMQLDEKIDGQAVTLYFLHLNDGANLPNVGDKLKVGDFIGFMGGTGVNADGLTVRSTGVHLHLEIRVGGFPVNPLKHFYLQSYVRTTDKLPYF